MAKVSKKTSKKDDSTLFAFLAVLLSFTLIGFVIAIILKKNNNYVMYYAKQSLVLFIAGIIVSVIGWVPFFGWIAGPLLWVVLIVLWIIALVYSLSGQMKSVPIIGDFAEKFDF